jgi:hypothetical protein
VAIVSDFWGIAGGSGFDEHDTGKRRGALLGLVPNVGAAPPSTYYTVVYQLDDASTPTKYSRYSSALHVDFPA